MTEIKNPSIAAALAEVKQDQAIVKQEDVAWMAALKDFDWHNIPPHQMAVILTKKPYKGSRGDPDYYLTPEQALIFAMRCYEVGVSPLSGEAWFNPNNWSVSLTLEGKRRVARQQGMNLGPARFERIERNWPKGKLPVAGFDKDVGYTCTRTIGNHGEATYTAWLSEWYVSYSPVWKEKPEHMLQVRADEKNITFATGVGVSEMPDEKEIEGQTTEVPQITATKVEYRELPEITNKEDLTHHE